MLNETFIEQVKAAKVRHRKTFGYFLVSKYPKRKIEQHCRKICKLLRYAMLHIEDIRCSIHSDRAST